jgi:hypothetical protein
MLNPEDQARLDKARSEMEAATGDAQAVAIRNFRVIENKALRRSLTDLGELLSKSPVKSRHRSIAFTAIEDSVMRLGKDLSECAEPNPYPNSRDTSNLKVDATAPEAAPRQ